MNILKYTQEELTIQLQELGYDGRQTTIDEDGNIAFRLDDVLDWLRIKYRLIFSISHFYTSTKSWKEWYNPDEFDYQWEIHEYVQDNEDSLEPTFLLLDWGTECNVPYIDGYYLAQQSAVQSAAERLLKLQKEEKLHK